MSDYYGLPISIPQGVAAPNVSSLYQSGTNTAPLSGLLGRTPSYVSSLAGDASPLFTGGLRGAARVAVPFGIGQLATAGINKVLPESAGRQVLGDIATGAGIGGSAGLLGGPFAGVTVPVGAVAGGVAGGTYALLDNLFGSDESTPDYKATLAQSASQAGLTPSTYTNAYDLLSQAGIDLQGNPLSDKKALAGQLAIQVLQDSAAKKQQDQAQQIATQQHASDQRFALAMQAQIQDFLKPYTNNIMADGLARAEQLKAHASNLPPAYASVVAAQADEAIASSQRIAAAYAGQAVALPGQYMIAADIKRQQELAQLQYQQSVVNAQQGGAGANFSSLSQQLAGQAAGQ